MVRCCLGGGKTASSPAQRAEIDLDYTDTASLALSTSVLINIPRPRFAVLPVSIGVELVSFGGTVSPRSLFFLSAMGERLQAWARS